MCDCCARARAGLGSAWVEARRLSTRRKLSRPPRLERVLGECEWTFGIGHRKRRGGESGALPRLHPMGSGSIRLRHLFLRNRRNRNRNRVREVGRCPRSISCTAPTLSKTWTPSHPNCSTNSSVYAQIARRLRESSERSSPRIREPAVTRFLVDSGVPSHSRSQR